MAYGDDAFVVTRKTRCCVKLTPESWVGTTPKTQPCGKYGRGDFGGVPPRGMPNNIAVNGTCAKGWVNP